MTILTEGQHECLRALATFDHVAPREPKASEVAQRAGHVRYWATDKLNALERKKLVRRSGSVPPWGWRVTDFGRELLAAGRPST